MRACVSSRRPPFLWIEADDNYVHVHTAERAFLLRRTLQDLLQQLGEERFARIHRSTAVNVAEIAGLDRLPKGTTKCAFAVALDFDSAGVSPARYSSAPSRPAIEGFLFPLTPQ